MKTKLITFLIATLGLVWSAQATVSYGTRTLNEVHIRGVKGFLYDVITNNPRRDLVIQLKPKFARAIVWLDASVASRLDFKLKDLASTDENAEVISEALAQISKVAHGDSPLDAENTIERWVTLGERVEASYSERQITNNRGQRETIIDYEISLREATLNLIYRHNEEEEVALPLFYQNHLFCN
jgi:hypothetical protein